MTDPVVTIGSIGTEAQPLVTIDDFAPDPGALRAAAQASKFGAAAHYYPGIRAALPDGYWPAQLPIIAAALAAAFGPHRAITLIDASFSIVTRSPAALTMRQRLPHCDALARNRFAFVHYLSPDRTDGTAFFRHRATGFETIDAVREPHYRARLDTELRDGTRPTGYIAEDTTLFERIMVTQARYNRAVLYRSCLLHSGAIAPGAILSPDPASGRLTVTAFLEVEDG